MMRLGVVKDHAKNYESNETDGAAADADAGSPLP